MEASVRERSYEHEAEKCRRQAEQFAGRAEAPFLLRLATSFEELQAAPRLRRDQDGHDHLVLMR